MLLINKKDVGYLNFSVEDGVELFDDLKNTFNANEINDKEVTFATFNKAEAIQSPIIVAYTNSDTMIPQLEMVESKEILIESLIEEVEQYAQQAEREGTLDDDDTIVASDEEIRDFVNSLDTRQSSLTIFQNDYELVVTAFILGGNYE